MAAMSTVKKTRKDKQILMVANVAHALNLIDKKTAGDVLRQYKKIGDTFDPTSYMLAKKYINKPNLLALKKNLYAFETIQNDTRFGALCVNFGFLTDSNLELALTEQQLLIGQGENNKLGDILVKAGMISNGQCQLVLVKQKINIKILGGSSSTNNEKNNTPEINKKNMREIKSGNFIFFIQNDALKAYSVKSDLFDPSTSLEELKQSISNQEILHGVVNGEKLQAFLDSKKYFKDDFFTLAEGDAPVHGVDATTKIYFEEEYKAAGKVNIDGSIDYKDRGSIPTVKRGDLLAEKTMAKEGESGLNVFDEILPPEAPKETFLKHGVGTAISDDGLNIYAEVNGYPKKEITGEIIVNEIFAIDGDVDYHTGHVSYDKSVNISGSIKNGFKVNAIDIVVDEVDGGILHAKGNVIVRKGIIDGQVKAKGKITASYILRSNISCFGDIEAIKEISDSEIFTDGKCRVRVGKVFSSSITAKGGVYIRNIGTVKAKRVTLTVGTSPNYEKELKEIDKAIEENQNELEQMTYEKNNARNEIKELNTTISQIAMSIKKTQAIIEKLDDTNKHGTEMMEQSLCEAKEKSEVLEIQKQEFENKFQESKDAETLCSRSVRDSIKDKFILKKSDQNNPPKPIVKVEGTIVAGTLIAGRHSKIIINESKNRVKIMEIQITGEEIQRKNSWEMIIADL
ncbi:MAG: DUF342 domain-containing protein [Desulfobacteraceae bacterium]|nr:DUF342 domain-containing protein [Desulfobacteraceae bacterium]